MSGVLEVYDERVVDHFEYSVFGHGVEYGVVFDDVFLPQDFHRINTT